METRAMRKAALTLLFVAASSASLADVRHNVGNLSCDRVQAILKAEGSAILAYRSKTNPSIQRYDRFVRDAGLCSIGRQVLSSTSIPVAGGQSCRVGKCVTTKND
jgi:hypothetical protein